MKRDRSFASWDDDDYEVVGIPVDDSGNAAREYVSRLVSTAEATAEWTGHKMLHSDGRTYEDVVIRSREHNPSDIVSAIYSYLPDFSLISEAAAKAVAKH